MDQNSEEKEVGDEQQQYEEGSFYITN